MFYPTGTVPAGKMVICMDDESPEIEKVTENCDEGCMLECLTEWLNEAQCCLECWQLKEYLKNKGIDESRIDEDMAAGGAAAGAPAPGLATLGNTPGMGNVQAPMNGGTNAGFYNNSLNGSGDKFPSLTAGTQAAKKKRLVQNYLGFMRKKRK
jgi:hypothetical protein